MFVPARDLQDRCRYWYQYLSIYKLAGHSTEFCKYGDTVIRRFVFQYTMVITAGVRRVIITSRRPLGKQKSIVLCSYPSGPGPCSNRFLFQWRKESFLLWSEAGGGASCHRPVLMGSAASGESTCWPCRATHDRRPTISAGECQVPPVGPAAIRPGIRTRHQHRRHRIRRHLRIY